LICLRQGYQFLDTSGWNSPANDDLDGFIAAKPHSPSQLPKSIDRFANTNLGCDFDSHNRSRTPDDPENLHRIGTLVSVNGVAIRAVSASQE